MAKGAEMAAAAGTFCVVLYLLGAFRAWSETFLFAMDDVEDHLIGWFATLFWPLVEAVSIYLVVVYCVRGWLKEQRHASRRNGRLR